MSFARSKEIFKRVSIPAFLILLLTLIGCSGKEATRMEQTAVPARPSREQIKIDSLETENVSLKQKMVKLEQDNNKLNARLSDVEAKLREEMEKAVPPPPPQPPPLTTTYEAGQKAFAEKKYDDAITIFQSLIDGGIAEDQADNCRYWMGESYFGKKNYAEAVKQFESVLQYKASEKKGDALYMLGRSYELQGDKPKAKEMFEKVVKDYPTNDNVKKAKERWGRL